jgi:hypothetical protein
MSMLDTLGGRVVERDDAAAARSCRRAPRDVACAGDLHDGATADTA